MERWTKEEIWWLRRTYPKGRAEAQRALPHKTLKQICNKAYTLRLKVTKEARSRPHLKGETRTSVQQICAALTDNQKLALFKAWR